MTVILAQINGEVKLSGGELDKFKKACFKVGINQVLSASSVQRLQEILGTIETNECILFSNFPPNSTYPGSEKPTIYTDLGDYIGRSYEADSYAKSTALFSSICRKYHLMAIHFITGAPQSMVDEAYLKSVCKGTPISYQPNKQWVIPGNNYAVFYRVHVTELIQSAMSMDK